MCCAAFAVAQQNTENLVDSVSDCLSRRLGPVTSFPPFPRLCFDKTLLVTMHTREGLCTLLVERVLYSAVCCPACSSPPPSATVSKGLQTLAGDRGQTPTLVFCWPMAILRAGRAPLCATCLQRDRLFLQRAPVAYRIHIYIIYMCVLRNMAPLAMTLTGLPKFMTVNILQGGVISNVPMHVCCNPRGGGSVVCSFFPGVFRAVEQRKSPVMISPAGVHCRVTQLGASRKYHR